MSTTTATPITKDQIQNLKITFQDVLPRGYIKEIATRTGYSEIWIQKVIAGSENPNTQIIHTALQLIKEQSEKSDEFLRQFNWEG